MVVTQWSYGGRQPSGSRCVVVSGHCLRVQLGPRVNLATTVYCVVDARPVYWFAFVFLADVFDTYALAVLVLLFSRISRLSGIVSTDVANSVRLPRQAFFHRDAAT